MGASKLTLFSLT